MRRSALAAALLVGAALGAGSVVLWDAWGSRVAGLAGAPARGAPTSRPKTASFYTCSMHPRIVRPEPGRCPICGMDLVPVRPAAQPSGGAAPPHGAVRVGPRFVQNFSVRTEEVSLERLAARIRTVGYLDQDEEAVVSVSPKYGGWIERAHVHTVGERVSAGAPLFEIYSPMLVTAQRELLAARRYVSKLRQARAHADAIGRAEALQGAAAERLRHWDLTPGQISSLERSGEFSRTVLFHAPASGYIVEKASDSLEGLTVLPGQTVLKIADHSTLWAKVEFYERQVRDLRAGLKATIVLEAFPGRLWNGEVLFFRPAMDPGTQTLTGYVEVSNPDGLLRPKMYATVEVRLPEVRGPTVSAQAVLHSGERSVVIVDLGDGLFEPREVDLGLESDGRVLVLAGVRPGERIVTSSQFLIDSESNLREAVGGLLNADSGAAGDMPGHRH